MSDFEPVLMANVGKENSYRLDTYRSTGGYETLRKTLQSSSPQEVVAAVSAAELRGRGGAGFPTGQKWSFLPKDHQGPIYMCINADESEPGTFCNRVLLEHDPHQVIEGTILGCFATGTSRAYLYLRYEYPLAFKRIKEAITECYEAGLLGQNILGSAFSLDMVVHRGAAAYVCGEETGLIESIEGHRAWPRVKPPYPAVQGLFQSPTVVNNVETLACVRHIIERGSDWFRSMGTPPDPEAKSRLGSYGPKMFGLSGHINRPGCYEAPLGIPCDELIERFGGGVSNGRKVKAVVPGGLSVGLLKAEELDTPMDFEGPVRAGCLGLGTGCAIVLDESYSILDFLYNSCRFFAHESCGQCTPCREGTRWALELVEKLRSGRGGPSDVDLLAEIGDTIGLMPGTTICGLADGAAWPIKTAVAKFRDELCKAG
ncbi:MAG: NADH-quinone oxidoreductase subunit NuoF [Planctomycetia bacterium]|jgi:NADH-quinone oxidoreductase subunit F